MAANRLASRPALHLALDRAALEGLEQVVVQVDAVEGAAEDSSRTGTTGSRDEMM